MIREIEIGGQKMVAIVLGDSNENDPETYRESLLDVIDATLQEPNVMENVNKCQLSDCLRLARALEK